MEHQAGVTLAVGAVILKGDQVLLIRRARAPFAGHWSIPGGKVQFGETLASALHREILEETALSVDVLGLVGVFEALPEKPGDRHFVMVDYACDWRSGDPRAGDDAADAEFVPVPEALARLAWDKTRQAIQASLAFRRRSAV